MQATLISGLRLKYMLMRTTVALHEELVRKALELTGTEVKAQLIREAVKVLIEKESARRLASLGGSAPHLESIPRRRPRRNNSR